MFSTLGRSGLLKGCSVGALVLTIGGQASAVPMQAKNVILMISDGQGFNTVKAAEQYTGAAATYEGAGFLKLGMQTYSATGNNPYNSAAMFNGVDAVFAMTKPTDSASAATAMYTGVKVYDGEVNWTVDNKPLTTYFEQMAKADRSIGAVSSVELSHATPAAVYGHNSSRNNYAAIASEGVYGSNPLDGSVANSGSNPNAGNNGLYDALNYNDHFKVLMGAGHGDYNDNNVLDPSRTDRYAGGDSAWADILDGAPNDWTFVQDKADFDAIAAGVGVPDKLLGVAQVNTTLQQGRTAAKGADPSNPSGIAFNDVPTLATMTSAALNVLGQDSDGFAVMIEGGAVDWANHANQIDRMLEEQIDFNNAVDAAIAWVEANSSWDETLLIVTADHETGNLWGDGSYTDMNGNNRYDPGTDIFNGYQPITAVGNGVLTGVQYLSGNHTNALVPLYAKGAGASLFLQYTIGTEDIASRYGVAGFTDDHLYIDNTAIYHVMVRASTPEPATMTMGVMALGSVLLMARRRR